MDSTKKLRFGLLAVAIALVAASVPANAQQLYKATFDLPFESQWGTTVVEPGHYTITVEEALGQKLIRLHGSVEMAIFAGATSSEPERENGTLSFVNINGVNTLKAFSAGELGQAFQFPVHKAKGERAQVTSTTVALRSN
jgi:hypothetical protein